METANRIDAPGRNGQDRTGTPGAGYRRVLLSLVLALLLPLALGATAGPAQAQGSTEEGKQAGGNGETAEIEYAAAEIEMVELINGYRRQKGLEPLLVSDTASLAAKRHSEDMARYGFMDHDSQQSAYFEPGATFDERMDESGYDYETARSENIAAGAGVEETFEGWRNSPEHEKNMLDPGMKVIGIGLSEAGSPEDSDFSEGSTAGEYDTYWTTDFGGHVDETATEPSKIEVETDSGESGNQEQREDSGPPLVSKETQESATTDQYGQGSGAGEDESTSTGEESIEPADTGDGDSGSEAAGSEQGATKDQYSTGEEESSGDDSSSDNSSSESGGGSGEQTTIQETTGGDTSEPRAGDQPLSGDSGDPADEGSSEESGGDRDCDTLAGFDKSPLDSGFGSELTRRIQDKVDCQLANAGIGGEDGGTDTTRKQNTSEETAGSDSGSSDTSENDTGENDSSESAESDRGANESGGGFLSGLFASSTGDEGEEPVDAGSSSEAATAESGEDGSAVRGPASTGEELPTDNGRED